MLRADALTHNLTAMADWCRDRGVELAPHGKTHMAPQLFARQLDAGACGITAATLSHVRTYRAFGVRDVVLANELVDAAGLRWLAAELDADPDFSTWCAGWIRCAGVELMTAALTAAGAGRPVDVCVEVGMPGGRTGCRGRPRSTRSRGRPPRRRGCGWSVSQATRRRSVTTSRPTPWPASRGYLRRCARQWCGWPRCSRRTSDRDRGRQHIFRRGRRRPDR